MTQVILGKSRVREICMPGSVRAKAKWLSYSTNPQRGQHNQSIEPSRPTRAAVLQITDQCVIFNSKCQVSFP